MSKFELNPRTGLMEPKKDDNIYFTSAQSGGLRVDDKKHKVTYVIERDGRITNIAGIRDGNVNLYDMRDARIIADRVIRKLGPYNKYTDFHYFLKGYVMKENVVKMFDEFVNEGVFSGILKRSYGDDIRQEDGKIIGELPDGTKLIVPSNGFPGGELVKFLDDVYYYFEEIDSYLVCFTSDGTDTFYRLDKDAEPGYPNLIKSFACSDLLRKNQMDSLTALFRAGDNLDENSLDGMEAEYRNTNIQFFLDDMGYMVFWDSDDAWRYAVESCKESLEDSGILTDKKILEKWKNMFGDCIFNKSDIEDVLRESYECYYDDLNEEDAIDALLSKDIIEDSEEYFNLDEDGEIDHTSPKFDYIDYKDNYVDAVMDSIDNVVDEYICQYGVDELSNYMDIEELAKCIIQVDGVESEIASYDGVEGMEYVNHKDYYIYRTD